MRHRPPRSTLLWAVLAALASLLLAGCTSAPQQSTTTGPNASNDTQNSTNVTNNSTLVAPTMLPGPATPPTSDVAPSPTTVPGPYNYGP